MSHWLQIETPFLDPANFHILDLSNIISDKPRWHVPNKSDIYISTYAHIYNTLKRVFFTPSDDSVWSQATLGKHFSNAGPHSLNFSSARGSSKNLPWRQSDQTEAHTQTKSNAKCTGILLMDLHTAIFKSNANSVSPAFHYCGTSDQEKTSELCDLQLFIVMMTESFGSQNT